MYTEGTRVIGEASGYGYPLKKYILVIEEFSTKNGFYQCHMENHDNLKIIKYPNQLTLA